MSEIEEDPPEFGIEAEEDFVEGDIPSVPILTDFIPDLQSLVIEPSHEVSEEIIEEEVPLESKKLQNEEAKRVETNPELSSEHHQEESETFKIEANAPPMFHEEAASAPQFEVPMFEVKELYPHLDVEASAPMFEDEFVSEAKEETSEIESQENEASYAVIQPFTESQVC